MLGTFRERERELKHVNTALNMVNQFEAVATLEIKTGVI